MLVRGQVHMTYRQTVGQLIKLCGIATVFISLNGTPLDKLPECLNARTKSISNLSAIFHDIANFSDKERVKMVCGFFR